MPLRIEWAQSPALVARLRAIQQAAGDTSRTTNRVKGDIRTIVEDDHVDKMLRGVDRYGKPRTPLAPSTLANRRRGGGPSLVPRGTQSRYITQFRTDWVSAADATRVLRMYFQDFTSPKGFPIPIAHEYGTARIPARPIGGVTPKGWSQITTRCSQYAAEVLKGE